MIIKYKVEKTFKDKYSKEIIKEKNIIDVSIDRMKELNAKNIGRVVDILEEDLKADKNEKTEEETLSDTNTKEETQITNEQEENKEELSEEENKEKYTKEQLQNMTVNQLKELAEKINCELTKAKKDEIVNEIIEFQNK